MSRLPQEIIMIVAAKKRIEEDGIKMKAFESCIIPWIYQWRDSMSIKNDPTVCRLGNLVASINDGPYCHTSFILTSVKRVCSRLRGEVSLGNEGELYHPRSYRKNKKTSEVE
uniref:Uncharacterized protein n=1 Tax=Clandestinovirus TaxID=2831644 RepID=A0A8F8KP11_9VIRU|nr:hypothetical protein KOM_12_167 [Clandestinovirus]